MTYILYWGIYIQNPKAYQLFIWKTVDIEDKGRLQQ